MDKNSGDEPVATNTIVLTDLFRLIQNCASLMSDIVNHLILPIAHLVVASSGLSLSSTTCSSDGGSNYTYPAPADAEGANTMVTNLKSAMSGSFLPQTGTTAPWFTLKFRVIIE
ncbi:hypothetical protein [uncultured Cocleimonas sp.]|uniref:hypothetical protein n=1 Tax=uncultured Cocleimonas sp. TaxID=1051587 RepID=UPI00262690E6|nr:hypothetical protein [uncultured Cocleimonas sp.]